MSTQPAVKNAIQSSTARMLENTFRVDPNLKRWLFILLLNPEFMDVAYHSQLQLLCMWWARLEPRHIQTLKRWMEEELEHTLLETMLQRFQNLITVTVISEEKLLDYNFLVQHQKMPSVILAMDRVFQVNSTWRKRGKPHLSPDAFYNVAINEVLEEPEERYMFEDYKHWRKSWTDDSGRFCFARYPFILDPANKKELLTWDAKVQQQLSYRRTMTNALMAGLDTAMPYLLLRVDRSDLINSCMTTLVTASSIELKKPLKVHFNGEEGIDEGGLRAEFFQLIIEQLFDPLFGMFQLNEESRTYWFRGDSLESEMEYELIGSLVGIAIYNDVILNLAFPGVVYKKLLGQAPTLEDFAQIDPALTNGLQQLLAMEGNVEEILCRSFVVEKEVYGETKVVELKEGGQDIPVTNDNREEFVQLYLNYAMNTSVARQYNAFRAGFMNVCDGKPLRLFQPEELELLIRGSEELDFEELEAVTRYDDGFEEDSATIRFFWEVVHEMKLPDQKKLLEFCTGSDRVPIKGLGSMSFTISKNGTDPTKLPTSHTCFNHLLLPVYENKAQLEKALYAGHHMKSVQIASF
jgi:ubiquitin-protein ligase E3 A